MGLDRPAGFARPRARRAGPAGLRRPAARPRRRDLLHRRAADHRDRPRAPGPAAGPDPGRADQQPHLGGRGKALCRGPAPARPGGQRHLHQPFSGGVPERGRPLHGAEGRRDRGRGGDGRHGPRPHRDPHDRPRGQRPLSAVRLAARRPGAGGALRPRRPAAARGEPAAPRGRDLRPGGPHRRGPHGPPARHLRPRPAGRRRGLRRRRPRRPRHAPAPLAARAWVSSAKTARRRA